VRESPRNRKNLRCAPLLPFLVAVPLRYPGFEQPHPAQALLGHPLHVEAGRDREVLMSEDLLRRDRRARELRQNRIAPASRAP